MAEDTKSFQSPEYSGSHTAPTPDNGAPMHDVTGIYPDDFYSHNGLRYYGTGDDKLDSESYFQILSAKARPFSRVDIYRAVPKNINNINEGDWVTINRRYAKEHGESTLLGDYKILKKTVRARDLHTSGDSFHEWGYWPKKIPVKFADLMAETNESRKKFGMPLKASKYSTEPSKASGGPVEDQDIASPPPAEDESITAYHGSPHEFERFDTSKIGTGEGAQAYGHGLYFAEHEPIAKSYRDALALDPRDAVNRAIKNIINSGEPATQDNLMFELRRHKELDEYQNDSNFKKDLIAVINGTNSDNTLTDNAMQAIRRIDKLLLPKSQGYMYEVKIKAHPDHFLDWDRPLNQQSDYVKKCLGIGLDEVMSEKIDSGQIDKSKLPIIFSDGENSVYAHPSDRGNGFHLSSTGILNNYFPMGPNSFAKNEEEANKIAKSWIKGEKAWGSNLHENFLRNMRAHIQNSSENFGTAESEVSRYYADRGLKGIKYLDAGSRSSGNGTRNYVVFDDKLLDIKRRYEMGGAVPMASGGEVEDQMTGRPLSDKETKDLVGKIQSVLTPDLLEPKYRKQSEGQHPTFGHCASATQAAYYMLGGKESGYVPQVAKEDDGTTHWWLKHRQTGHVIDPTKEQYTSQGEKPPYDRGRGCGFPNPNPDAPSRRGQEIIDRIQRRYEMGEAVPMASGGEVGDNSPMPMTPDQQRMLDDLSAALDRAAARYGTTGYAADPAAQQAPAPRHEPTMPGEPALTRGQEQEYHIGQLQNALARVPTGYAEGGDVEDNPAVQKALAVTSGVPVTSGAAANFIQNTSNPKRIMVPATGPGGIKGIVIPRHMWEGGNGKHGLIPGLRDINQARAAVYGSQNRDPLTIGKVAEIHKQTLDEHFKRPVDEQIARENEALERLRAAKHIGKSADTLDESEKLDTVRHEYDDQGRPHVGYGSKGVAGYALYSSGHGPNQKFHVLNVCPGSVAGCSGGIDANGIADTSRGTCFAPVAESQYPGAAIRRACHAQAKFDPAMTSDWILAHTGSLRRAAERADKNGERVLFRPNVVDESDRSSRYAIKHLNDQRKAYSESAKLNLPLPDIIANSYGKTTELHDPDNGFFVTYSNTGPKTKLGYSVSENIQRDKQRVRSTILAQDAAGRDFVNDDGEETPPKGSYMVTDVKRDSPLDEKMRKAFKYAKYWSVGRPVSSLSKDEAAEGEEAHYDGKGKPTTPEKAHYGHVTLNGKRYDYQKQHILHRRLVQVGKNKDGSPHMIPTDSRFKDEEFLPSTRYMTRSGKLAGHILITTPTTSTSNAGHQTAFTHHVNESHIAHASKNKGEYEIDPPAAQEASAGKEYAPPKDVGHFAYGGTVDDEIGEHLMAFPERSHYAQIHNVHRSRHNDEKEIGSKRSHGIKSIDRALRLTSQYNQPTRGRP